MFSYSNVIANFSGTPRKEQIEALQKICKVFDTKKFAIANIPTGVGKSHIAAALCNTTASISTEYANLIETNEAFKRDYSGKYIHQEDIENFPAFGGAALTTTKSLQDQYSNIFSNSEILKGKTNYQCNVDGTYTVDVAPCLLSPKLKEQCLNEKTCAFYNQRVKALTSKFSVLNYNVFLTLPQFVRRRQLLICDEATEIEEVLVSKHSIHIQYVSLERDSIPYSKLKTDTTIVALKWLTDLYITVDKIVSDLVSNAHLKTKKNIQTHFKDIKRLQKLTSFAESLSSVISSWNKCEYIIEKTTHSVTFTPYNVDNLSRELFDSADRVLLMGAFLPKKTIEFLGISPAEYEYLEIASPFDSKKSPIYCSNKYALSHKTLDKMLPKVIDQAITICNGYDKEKGVVHTHSMQITEAFQKRVYNHSRYLFRVPGSSNEDIIQQHTVLKDMPTVVVSPSVAFGVSFDDDQGRFQIIIKAPYLPLGSKRIKLLFEREPAYYQTKMLINLVQMCGRCTRSKDDYSATFILDATVCKALHREVDKLPKYFIDRFI